MAIATIAQSTLSGTLTVAGIANALRDLFLGLGFTLFDSYLSGSTEGRVMAYQFSAAAKGTAYLQILVNSAGTISYQLFDAWNTSTKAGTNGSVSQNIATVTSGNNAITFTTVSHPEWRGAVVEQTTTQGVIALVRPKGSPPSWWNETNVLYAFVTKYNATPANSRLAATNTPFGIVQDHEYLQSSKLQDGNAQNSNARSVLPLCIMSNAVGGIIAACDDVIISASNGVRVLDTYPVSASEIYTYIWGNAQSSGIAIRTT